MSGAGIDPMAAITQWEQENSPRLTRARATLAEISSAGGYDLATLSVAARALARL
jgi:glutamate dehydrogenase